MSLLPSALYRSEQVRELDRRATEVHGLSPFTLMQRAAAAVHREMRWRWPEARRVAVVCGPGNNGGDGFLTAVLARESGYDVQVLLVGAAGVRQGAVAEAWAALGRAGVQAAAFAPEALDRADIIVDALLGIGLARAVEGRVRAAIETINARRRLGSRVLAVDIPSGLDADRGTPMPIAVEADVTVSFIGLKLGLFVGEGLHHCGRLVFSGLEVPEEAYAGLTPTAECIGDQLRRAALSPRRRTAHKGDHGHVLLVGGDDGMAGAIRIAGEACLRAGAGLVSVATRASHAALITQARPELMCRGIEERTDIDAMVKRARVLAIGPGLGQGDWGRGLWGRLQGSQIPMVVDADALNLLAEKVRRRDDWILTPHPGEAARLLGCTTEEIQRDRPAAVQALAQRYGGVVVLKGAGTLVLRDGGGLRVCDAGNPGMATGGTGDLLCGVIAGLLAQGLKAERAATIGVLIHARAGDLAAASGGERGLIASDLLQPIRALANP